jgi:hypothetical protein
MNLPGR